MHLGCVALDGRRCFTSTPPILASGELTVTADLYLASAADCEMKIILLVVDYIYPFHEEIFMQFVIF